MRCLIAILLAAQSLACIAPSPSGIPDEQIGLSKVEITDIPTPDVVVDNNSQPGETPLAPREFADSPPPIPHGIGDYLPITRDENLCVDCHVAEGEKVEGEPAPLPPSHRTDLRNAPETVKDEVAGARFVCVSCHVQQRDVAPLVGNDFSG